MIFLLVLDLFFLFFSPFNISTWFEVPVSSIDMLSGHPLALVIILAFLTSIISSSITFSFYTNHIYRMLFNHFTEGRNCYNSSWWPQNLRLNHLRGWLGLHMLLLRSRGPFSWWHELPSWSSNLVVPKIPSWMGAKVHTMTILATVIAKLFSPLPFLGWAIRLNHNFGLLHSLGLMHSLSLHKIYGQVVQLIGHPLQ